MKVNERRGYLRMQGFWQGFTLEMAPAQSPESCFVCELNEEFFALLGDADSRLKARLLLVASILNRVNVWRRWSALEYPAEDS